MAITERPAVTRLGPGVAFLIVVFAGVVSRRVPDLLPALLRKNTGDVLWATALALACAFASPRASIVRLAALCGILSAAVEFSKLCDAPWLHRIRWSVIGRLLLGTTFSCSNLLCYAIGIALGVAILAAIRRRGARNANQRAPLPCLTGPDVPS
jgi:hypothetical protein